MVQRRPRASRAARSAARGGLRSKIGRVNQLQPFLAAKSSAPSPTKEHVLAVLHDLARREDRVARGALAMAPERSVAPSMMAASSSCVAALVKTEPWPALNSGQSSSRRTASVTASRARCRRRPGLAGLRDGLQRAQVLLFFLRGHGRADIARRAAVNGDHGLNHRLPTPCMSHGITDWVTPAAAATEFLARWATAADRASISPRRGLGIGYQLARRHRVQHHGRGGRQRRRGLVGQHQHRHAGLLGRIGQRDRVGQVAREAMAMTRSLLVMRDIWRAAWDTPPGPASDSTECRHAQAALQHAGRKPLAPKPMMKTRSAPRMMSTACSQASASILGLRWALRMSSSSVAARSAPRWPNAPARCAAFHGFQRGLETARQLGAELRVASSSARAAVGRGHRHAHRRGEFVDRHGGDAELVRQHVLGHLVLGAAQRGLGGAIRSRS